MEYRDKTENLIPFVSGVSGNPNGRPKGAKNRSTVIREILALVNETGKDNEYSINMAQVERALNGDTNAYKAIMDNAYKPHTQQIEQTEIKRVIDWGLDDEPNDTGETP